MCNHMALPSEQRKPERAQVNSRKGQKKRRGGPENAAYRFKGVRQRKWGKWVAEARKPGGPRFWVGTFDNAVDAALAYDREARRLLGAKAKVNFPEWQPPENPPPQINLDLQLGPPGSSADANPGAN